MTDQPTVTPGTEEHPAHIPLTAEVSVVYGAGTAHGRQLEVWVDLAPLWDRIDASEWTMDDPAYDLTIEWCCGKPSVHAFWWPAIDDEDLWEAELEETTP